jgi:hypothetical protein
MSPTRLGKTDYYLMSDPMSLKLYYKWPDGYYSEPLFPGRVTDVYWNEQYILVTRSDVWSDSIEGYYIIKMLPFGTKRGVPCEKTGLLSKEEYEQKKQELGLNEKEMKYKRF